MIAPGSPTVRRRRLAAELRGIRESKGKSGDAVAAALKWSPSKISRYERARTGLRPREVERLLDYYGITGSHRALLLSLAEDAAQKGWWEEFADTLAEDYQQFIGLEHEATSIAIWHVDVVAGLLQTESYARHIIGSYSRVEPVAPGMIGRLVKVRMQRQQVLDREGLQLTVVLDESVLTRRIGDESVMYEQLQRLAQERIVVEVNLSNRQVVRRTPIGMHFAKHFRCERVSFSFRCGCVGFSFQSECIRCHDYESWTEPK